MRRLALSSSLCAAGLVCVLAGLALGQQQKMPPADSKGFRTEVLATLGVDQPVGTVRSISPELMSPPVTW